MKRATAVRRPGAVSTSVLPMANNTFPASTTIAPVGTLGYRAGAASSCPP